MPQIEYIGLIDHIRSIWCRWHQPLAGLVLLLIFTVSLAPTAQERAEKAGHSAEIVIRYGSFREALQEVAKEYNVSTVVLGYPTTDTAITTQEYINSLAEFLQTERNVEIYVLDNGDVVDHYQSPI